VKRLNRARQLGLRSKRGEQSVNNLLPNTRNQQLLSGITANVVNNQRTNPCRIPGIKAGLVRATDTKNPRVQAPALAYEPGGRRFESCRAHQINNLQAPFFGSESVVNNLFATVAGAVLPWARHLAKMAGFCQSRR
jgi:hypothetical protein